MDCINFEAEVEHENASSDEEFLLSAQEDNSIDDSVDDQSHIFIEFLTKHVIQLRH